jgi:hypothetical protein
LSNHESLQSLLGADYDVGGTRKLQVRGPGGNTVGAYDARADQVIGFVEVKFFGFERTPAEELRSLGEAEVREQLSAIGAHGFEVDFEAATVDPMGLSELTNNEDGADFLYVVDVFKSVDGVEEAAAVLGELAEETWRFSIREGER